MPTEQLPKFALLMQQVLIKNKTGFGTFHSDENNAAMVKAEGNILVVVLPYILDL